MNLLNIKTTIRQKNTLDKVQSYHVEPHIKESNYIRDIVFGFGDGVNTSLGIVTGMGGATMGVDIVILATIIGMFTGAKAMAV